MVTGALSAYFFEGNNEIFLGRKGIVLVFVFPGIRQRYRGIVHHKIN